MLKKSNLSKFLVGFFILVAFSWTLEPVAFADEANTDLNEGDSFAFKLIDETDTTPDTVSITTALTIGVGALNPDEGLKEILKSGSAVKLNLQLKDVIWAGINVDLEAGTASLSDKELEGSGIDFTYLILCYVLTKPTPYVDLRFRAGGGVTYVSWAVGAINKSSTDGTLSWGLGLQKTIKEKFIAGFDLNYFYLYEDTRTSLNSFSLYAGIRF